MKDEGLSRREWLLVIAVLMMVEYWLISISYNFVDDQALINYVSFGSTIASLLLAIVAIIYGFIQSDSSSKASAVLREQAGALESSTSGLAVSVVTIDQHLEKVVAVTSRLDGLDQAIRDSIVKVSSLETQVIDMHAASREFMAAFYEKSTDVRSGSEVVVSPSGSFSTESVVRTLLRSTSYDLDILGYSLFKYMESGDSATVYEFFNKYYKVASSVKENTPDATSYLNICMTALPALKAVDAVDYDYTGRKLVLNDNLREILPKLAADTRSSDVERVVAAVAIIDKVIS